MRSLRSSLLLLLAVAALAAISGSSAPRPANALMDCLSASDPDNYCATVLDPGNDFCCAKKDSCSYDTCTGTQCVSIAPTIALVSPGISTTSFTAHWTTCYAANGRVEWGTAPGSYTGTPVSNLTQYFTAHSMGVTGLNPSTTYYYRVTSCGSTGLCRTSPESSVTTSAASGDTTPPFITNIVISASSDHATITWTTNENATSRVEWGTTVLYGATGSPLTDSTLVTNHTLVMNGLSPTTTYYYVITSADAAGNSSNSGFGDVTHFFVTVAPGELDRIFTTGACTDPLTSAPVPIGSCTTGTPSLFCHSGGVLSLDCTSPCGYTCAVGQTCLVDGSCADNPTPNAANPYQCNDASCYDANGVFISPATGSCRTALPACNANAILQVRPDRLCAQWLTPRTTLTLTNPQTQAKEELSLSLSGCTELDASGRCRSLLTGKHCTLSPLTACAAASDCPGGALDRCVAANHCGTTTDASGNPKQCTRDADCGTSDVCISDNLVLFSPKDRGKLNTLTGSVQAGLTWGGAVCNLDRTKACVTDQDCASGDQCIFDPQYGRCSNDATVACTSNSGNCGTGTCLVESIAGRYPWEMNLQKGAAVSRLNNSGFEETEKIPSGTTGGDRTEYPTRPWSYVLGATIAVVEDPSLVGTTIAKTNHVLKVTPSKLDGSGARAPLSAFSASAGQPYYVSFKLRAGQSQKVQISIGRQPGENTPYVLDLTDQWQEKLFSFRFTSQLTGVYLYVVCKSGTTSGDCASDDFYLDNVSIQTALNVAYDKPTGETLDLPQTCRLYPTEDSQACDYTRQGVRYLGQKGYCLQRDPGNASLCLSWWPVDIIAGNVDFFGTNATVASYAGRSPLYYCVQSQGLNVSTAHPYTSNSSNWDTEASLYRSGDCNKGSNCSEYPENVLTLGVPVYAWDGGVDYSSMWCDLSRGGPSGSGASIFPTDGDGRVGLCDDLGNKFLGNPLGDNPWGSRTERDIYAQDIEYIDVHVGVGCNVDNGAGRNNDWCDGVGIPTGTFRLSAANNWQFLRCITSSSWDACPGETWDRNVSETDWGVSSAWGGQFPSLCQSNTNNIYGAKLYFNDSGQVSWFRMAHSDCTNDKGSIQFAVNVKFKERCSVVAQVATGGQAIPWAQRIQKKNYILDPTRLNYSYTKDTAPYGAVAEPPTNREDPTLWTESPLALATPSDRAIVTSGSPYACVGSCQTKICLGGAKAGQDCSAAPSTFCSEPDTSGNPGYCMGLGSTAAGPNTKGFQQFSTNPVNGMQSTYYAQARADRIFAKSYGVYRWTSRCKLEPSKYCFYNTGTVDLQACTKLGDTCVAGYYLISDGWDTPKTQCLNDPVTGVPTRPITPQLNETQPDTDFCGVPPTVKNVKVNNSTNPITVGNNAQITLTFNSTIDPEQLPLTRIDINWGDGTAVDTVEGTMLVRSDPNNPHVFDHTYIASQCQASGCVPKIQLQDNWDWCSSTTGNRNCSDVASNWVSAPAVKVSP